MKIYVARHGQTTWNSQNKVCGRTDVPLTEKGIEQAKALAREASKYDLDIIISSPLQRARETARVVAETCKIPVEVDNRLIEQDYGIYEGTDRKDPAFLANKKNFAYRYPKGESMMQMAYRLYGLLEEIKTRYAGKNVLLVCHGGVCRVLHTYFHDMTNEEFFHYNAENAKLAEYEL